MSNQKIGGVWEDLADGISQTQRNSRNPKYCPKCGRENGIRAPLTRCDCNKKQSPESIFNQPDKIEDCPSCDIEGTWNPNFQKMDICLGCPRYIGRKL